MVFKSIRFEPHIGILEGMDIWYRSPLHILRCNQTLHPSHPRSCIRVSPLIRWRYNIRINLFHNDAGLLNYVHYGSWEGIQASSMEKKRRYVVLFFCVLRRYDIPSLKQYIHITSTILKKQSLGFLSFHPYYTLSSRGKDPASSPYIYGPAFPKVRYRKWIFGGPAHSCVMSRY